MYIHIYRYTNISHPPFLLLLSSALYAHPSTPSTPSTPPLPSLLSPPHSPSPCFSLPPSLPASSSLKGRAKKKWEASQGQGDAKPGKMPYKMLVGIHKKRKERETKWEDRQKAAGVLLPKKVGGKKKHQGGSRGLGNLSAGRYKDGVLHVKA